MYTHNPFSRAAPAKHTIIHVRLHAQMIHPCVPPSYMRKGPGVESQEMEERRYSRS